MNLDPKQVRNADDNTLNSIEPSENHSLSSPQDGDFRFQGDLKERVGAPEAERGIPQDLSVRKVSTMTKVAMLVLGLFAVGLISAGVARYGSGWFSKKPKVEQQQMETTGSGGGLDFTKRQKETLASASAPVVETVAASEVKQEAASGVETASAITTLAASEPPPDLRLTSPLTFDDSESVAEGVIGNTGNGAGDAVSSDTSSLPGSGEEGEKSSGSKQQGLAVRLNPTVFASVTARLRGSLDFLLGRGTGIPCGLLTRIVTTYPGVTKCQVLEDVYSANGKVLLVEKGTIIHGEQQSALTQGQARVFAAWTTIETPNGVSVKIDSLGADPLGGSGHPARVNNHFWKRIGGAVMISMIDDTINAYGRRSQGSSNVSFDSTTESAQDIATEVLKNTINIPPTGYVNQGERIMVYIVRDVDFSGVYELVNTD
ncbi:type IV secretion system protein VirB10 [Neisseria dentiae]|uniref:type IV secretion system protein VirB10 n=1 Tax=Neisseria dentiae TaxID=194197 RepID=UPI00211C2BD1|nr:type IV secretion system protein VirB10 [Neisseria dentiae]MCQ9326907.1 type IV secretion system protein VirB10 [Neisseria dentiae]